MVSYFNLIMPEVGRNAKMKMKIFPAVVLLALLMLPAACATETGIAKDILEKEPDFRVTATEIVADYTISESAGDDKYKGKVIVVTGVISEIYRGFLYTPYVELEAGVRCSFSDNEDAVMLALSAGQTVSMKGQGDRLLFGVELRGCTVE
jgi:predicted small secreted protein